MKEVQELSETELKCSKCRARPPPPLMDPTEPERLVPRTEFHGI